MYLVSIPSPWGKVAREAGRMRGHMPHFLIVFIGTGVVPLISHRLWAVTASPQGEAVYSDRYASSALMTACTSSRMPILVLAPAAPVCPPPPKGPQMAVQS